MRHRPRTAGFTLLEMLVVLVILGLVVGIAVSRGPSRSHGLQTKGLIAALVEGLRGARGRAISINRPVLIAINGETRSVAFEGGATIQVPPELALTAASGPRGEPGPKLAGIRFAPDGSSTGGRIVLAEGRKHTQIGIDWLTGRVSVADVRERRAMKLPPPLWGRAGVGGGKRPECAVSPLPQPDPARGGRFERGFTLLEVLVAFIIAALALGVMFDASLGGLRASETASRYQEALSLARSHLASVAGVVLSGQDLSGDDGRGFHWHLRIRPSGTVTLPRGPDEDPSQGVQAQATLYAIGVTETWTADGGERELHLDTARVGPGAPKGG